MIAAAKRLWLDVEMQRQLSLVRDRRLRSLVDFAQQEIYLPNGPYEGRLLRPSYQPAAFLWFREVDRRRFNRYVFTGPVQSGKTLAATGMMLNQLLRQAPAKGVRLIYITPLRALSRDLEKALIAPLADTQHRVAVRTGDTRASERAAIIRKPPALLITTPESLSQLLASPKSVDIFATVEQVVVDEWHDLIASKRGRNAYWRSPDYVVWRPN